MKKLGFYFLILIVTSAVRICAGGSGHNTSHTGPPSYSTAASGSAFNHIPATYRYPPLIKSRIPLPHISSELQRLSTCQLNLKKFSTLVKLPNNKNITPPDSLAKAVLHTDSLAMTIIPRKLIEKRHAAEELEYNSKNQTTPPAETSADKDKTECDNVTEPEEVSQSS
jgi:hypothetical protein